MTHYYLYVRAGLELNESSEFFKVAIGESERELYHKRWLTSFAFEHGHLFVVWSIDVDEFLFKCLESLKPTMKNLVPTTAPELINYLKTGEEIPSCLEAERNRHHLLTQLDHNYYTTCVLRRVPFSCSK